MPAAAPQGVAAYDDRPYFARALDHGLKNGIIDSEKLEAMRTEGAKGIVQIADFFGTAHLRSDLDEAVKRMVYLASLYLEHVSDGSLTRAARSLQEHSFLSHSRGGSQMLKALYAMPTDSTIHEPAEPHDVREFLRLRSLGEQWGVAEYRARLAERKACQDEIEAALWFADVMEIPRESLFGESAESVLDACLLTRVAGRFEGGLLGAQELKDFFKAARRSKKKRALDPGLLEDIPEAHFPVAEKHLKRIVAKDLPRIADTKIPFNDLVREYHDRFHHFTLSSEVSDYDTLVTDEWRKVTKGMTDTDSMNTVFLCLAAGKPPKPAITAAEAKAAVRAIRAGVDNDGAAIRSVSDFIRRCAPHQMVDGLISLWEGEFHPEMIEQLILEDTHEDAASLDATVRVLAEHCHITRPAKKR